MRTFSAAVVLLLFTAAAARSQETLKITPSISDNHVVVSFELDDAYNDAVREAIASGLRTTFTYDIELRMVVPTVRSIQAGVRSSSW